MTLPTIKDYLMPTKNDLPTNKVKWNVDKKRAILLIHDMQEYFIDAYEEDSLLIKTLVKNINILKSTCKELGIPIIYSAQPEGQTSHQRALLEDFWGMGIPQEGNKQRIISSLTPEKDDILLTKWRYSAFKKNDLLDIFKEQGRDQIIICGVYAHIGCLLTAADAFMEGIQPFFVGDAVADFTLEDHKQSLIYTSNRCAKTITTEQVKQALSNENDDLTKDYIREQVAEILGYNEFQSINDNENLFLLGMDSIRVMTFMGNLNKKGLNLSFVELAKEPTIHNWWELIVSKKDTVLQW
ncbi:isochorismatase family protein [Bacillus cereus]|uniref:isochorismatase n=1 Tax=Bacillus cereus TaxID=1396 RepID=A0AAW7NGD5_BACCE|nr:isochorismatase family protein [Bacillus cereus]MDN4872987.1 isochorismatase family protein [Bacillus cereus]WHT91499.1 isochorismatase family protein [Bacillus cereus]